MKKKNQVHVTAAEPGWSILVPSYGADMKTIERLHKETIIAWMHEVIDMEGIETFIFTSPITAENRTSELANIFMIRPDGHIFESGVGDYPDYPSEEAALAEMRKREKK